MVYHIRTKTTQKTFDSLAPSLALYVVMMKLSAWSSWSLLLMLTVSFSFGLNTIYHRQNKALYTSEWLFISLTNRSTKGLKSYFITEKGSFLSTIMKPFPRKWTSTAATRLRLHWKLKIRPPFYYYYRVLVYFQNALRNCTTTHMEIIGSASAENSWHWKLQFFTRRAVFCIYLGVMNNARSRKKRKTRIHISIL